MSHDELNPVKPIDGIPSDRLNSWKEIASHFNVSVRTVMRWEKNEKLPVHRHRHQQQSSIYAFKLELDHWWASRPDLKTSTKVSPPDAKEESSIAVLPFLNLSGNPDEDYLSDGLTEELIAELSQIPNLRVVARTSSFYFKGKTDDVRSVGQQLGVRMVLEGSLRRSENRFRATAQLIDTESGYHLWSQNYDHEMLDILDLQGKISRAIAGVLRLQLRSDLKEQKTRPEVVNLEAYELYLRGRHYLINVTYETLQSAIQCFERALTLDPAAARAYAGLADCYLALGAFTGLPSEQVLEKTNQLLVQALTLDDKLADAYASLGWIASFYRYDWSAAEKALLRAIEINPSNALAHLWYATMVMTPQGNMEEAAVYAKKACSLEPLSAIFRCGIGSGIYMARNYAKAIEGLEQALRLDAISMTARVFLGSSLYMTGRYEEAATVLQRIEPPFLGAGLLGCCLVRLGRHEDAIRLLESVKYVPLPMLITSCHLALLAAELGDLETGFQWLEKAYQSRHGFIVWLKVDPLYDPLRGDPRFDSMLKKINLIA